MPAPGHTAPQCRPSLRVFGRLLRCQTVVDSNQDTTMQEPPSWSSLALAAPLTLACYLARASTASQGLSAFNAERDHAVVFGRPCFISAWLPCHWSLLHMRLADPPCSRTQICTVNSFRKGAPTSGCPERHYMYNVIESPAVRFSLKATSGSSSRSLKSGSHVFD